MKFAKKTILSVLTIIMLVSFPVTNAYATTSYNEDNNQIEPFCMHPTTRYNCYGNVEYWLYGAVAVHYYCYTAVECDVCGSYLRTETSHLCYDMMGSYRIDRCRY
ncbi:hypothetical protein [uncultured Clostridium sp.]|uniref:hypothetical protein n=1 Tax=uncultured Clostridium sp. TaxID=59620 RepID=UPI00258E88EF|nr:hypothetical protein [uncultured Clostridium sp.]